MTFLRKKVETLFRGMDEVEVVEVLKNVTGM